MTPDASTLGYINAGLGTLVALLLGALVTQGWRLLRKVDLTNTKLEAIVNRLVALETDAKNQHERLHEVERAVWRPNGGSHD